MTRRITQLSLLGGYLALAGIIVLVVWTAASSAPIVQQIEAGLGRPLTCEEAYAHREINNHFYPDRASQGDMLYLLSLVSSVVMVGFGVLLAAIGYSNSLTRLRWPLVGLGLVLLAALLAYMPVVNTVACAVE